MQKISIDIVLTCLRPLLSLSLLVDFCVLLGLCLSATVLKECEAVTLPAGAEDGEAAVVPAGLLLQYPPIVGCNPVGHPLEREVEPPVFTNIQKQSPRWRSELHEAKS